MRIFSGTATAAALVLSVAVMGVSPALADENVPSDSASQSPGATVDPVESNPTQATSETETSPAVPEAEESPSVPEAEPQQKSVKPSEAAAPTISATNQILKPADGGTVSAGPLDYTFEAGGAGRYYVTLDCDYTYDYRLATASYAGQHVSGMLDSVEEGNSCTLTLEDYNYSYLDSVAFTVERTYPKPQIRNLRATPQTFYPRVRDGYKDRTRIKFGSRLDSAITVKIVRKSTGRTVRTITRRAQRWADWYQGRSITWDGRNKSDRTVRTGRYQAVVTSTLGGRSVTERVTLQVDTGFRTRHVSRTKDGWYDSRDTTSGNCYTSEYYPRGNHLDCWAGNFAEARYTFRVPDNAKRVRHEIRGKSLCCENGRLIRDARWVGPNRYQVRVRVTYWRSYVVKKVTLRYDVRERI